MSHYPFSIFIEERSIKIPEAGCWIWERSCQASGYGDFRLHGKHYLAHRASYEVFNGSIPVGMQVLHKCDVPSCVNPAHLFLGTNADNIADSVSKGRRKGITRNRPSGLSYMEWSQETKEKKRTIQKQVRDEIKRLRKAGASFNTIALETGVSIGSAFTIAKES